MMSVTARILDFIYPPRCGVCGDFIEEHTPACENCRSGFERIAHPLCVVCGEPFVGGDDHACSLCSEKKPPFVKVRAAGKYKGSLKQAILQYKFSKVSSLAKPLGKFMVEAFENEFDQGSVDVIMPVPLHVKRLRWRGFNQALLLSKELSSATGIEVDATTLKRIRHTRPQTRLPHKERPENVKGAFAVVRPNFVKERSILLVDDMATTLATIRECASILKKAGASSVMALTTARAVEDFGDSI